MKSMAEYALENKALIKLFIAFLVIGGLWSFYSMSKMEDPEITVKQALVMTVYPGATAHQVELEVSDKLEKAIRQMGEKRLSMFIPNCLPVPQYQWYLMTSVLSMECSIR